MAAFGASRHEIDACARLPNGPCNYRNIKHGQWAPTCGCRRFWIKTNGRVPIVEENEGRAWCFCGHHACYHDVEGSRCGDYDALQAVGLTDANGPGPASRRSAYQQVDAARAGLGEQRYRAATEATAAPSHTAPSGLGVHGVEPQPNLWQAINTYARNQTGPASEAESTMPSTAAPSVSDYQGRASPPPFVQQIPTQARLMGPPLFFPTDMNIPPSEIASATEVNTPSLSGTPDLRRRHSPQVRDGLPGAPFAPIGLSANKTIVEPAATTKSAAQPPAQGRPSSSPSVAQPQPKIIRPHPSQLLDPSVSQIELQNVLRTCVQRLDALESLSMSHVPIEEVEDRFENIQARLVEVESWKRDYETQQQKDGQSSQARKRRRVGQGEGSNSSHSDASLDGGSAMSTSSAISATAAIYANYTGRFDIIEHRLGVLEDRLPSFSNPWYIELVMLPWGRNLRGIWMPYETNPTVDEKGDSAPDAWRGVDSTEEHSLGGSRVGTSGWTSDSIMAWADNASDWLCPKACGPNSLVYRRLASCGLVKYLSLVKADAHSIMASIQEAYSGFLIENEHDSLPENTAIKQYRALTEAIVPLRKVKKSSRLRFLDRSEMVTSACWDATFMDSSVFMQAKGGQRRLYLTTSQSYLQSNDEQGWTWLDLKDMANGETTTSHGVQDNNQGNAVDQDCWVRHPALDGSPDYSQSFRSDLSGQSGWSLQSQHSSRSDASTHPPVPNFHLKSPISQFRQSRHARQPSASLPLPAPDTAQSITGGAGRRTASFENITSKQKRRQSSMSSEAARNDALFTPRLSREPPSPLQSENQTDNHSQGASSATRRRRGGTPFAYATPHSNTTNTVVTILPTDSDGDTEADTDIIEPPNANDEEWQGMAEDELAHSSSGRRGHTDRRSVLSKMDTDDNEGDEDDEDDEDDLEEELDLDEGLTVYEAQNESGYTTR